MQHDPRETFADLARRYCAWVEADGEAAERGRPAASALRRHLAALYAAGLELTALEHRPGEDRDDDAQGAGDPARAAALRERLAALPFSFYRVLSDGHRLDLDEAPLVGDLLDDALDVYLDLRAPLDEWDAGRREAACWSWSFGFEHHWGQHAADALKALHDFLHE